MHHWGHGYSYMVHHNPSNNHRASFLGPVFRCPCDVIKELPFIHTHEIKMVGHSKQVSQALAIKFLDSPLNAPTIMGFQPTRLGPISFVPQIADDYDFPTLIESLLCVLHKACGLSGKHWPYYR